jgi:hypothetical protein
MMNHIIQNVAHRRVSLAIKSGGDASKLQTRIASAPHAASLPQRYCRSRFISVMFCKFVMRIVAERTMDSVKWCYGVCVFFGLDSLSRLSSGRPDIGLASSAVLACAMFGRKLAITGHYGCCGQSRSVSSEAKPGALPHLSLSENPSPKKQFSPSASYLHGISRAFASAKKHKRYAPRSLTGSYAGLGQRSAWIISPISRVRSVWVLKSTVSS